jgi:hypothetical protein
MFRTRIPTIGLRHLDDRVVPQDLLPHDRMVLLRLLLRLLDDLVVRLAIIDGHILLRDLSKYSLVIIANERKRLMLVSRKMTVYDG